MAKKARLRISSRSHAAMRSRHDPGRRARPEARCGRSRPDSPPGSDGARDSPRRAPARGCGTPGSPAPGRPQERRPRAVDVPLHDVDRRLVDRQPVAHLRRQTAADALHIAGEQTGRVPAQPAAALREPRRIGEMVQRHDRLQPALPQRPDHAPVVLQRGVVAHALPRARSGSTRSTGDGRCGRADAPDRSPARTARSGGRPRPSDAAAAPTARTATSRSTGCRPRPDGWRSPRPRESRREIEGGNRSGHVLRGHPCPRRARRRQARPDVARADAPAGPTWRAPEDAP